MINAFLYLENEKAKKEEKDRIVSELKSRSRK